MEKLCLISCDINRVRCALLGYQLLKWMFTEFDFQPKIVDSEIDFLKVMFSWNSMSLIGLGTDFVLHDWICRAFLPVAKYLHLESSVLRKKAQVVAWLPRLVTTSKVVTLVKKAHGRWLLSFA